MKTQSCHTDLKKRVSRIAIVLEETLGIPIPPKKKSPPLDMLIATILSQNTNDKNSYRAYSILRERFPSWELVLKAKTSAIAAAIKTGGMANQKSVRIKKLLVELMKRYGTLDLSFVKKKSNEEIFELLTSLDGVGTKTASCVLLFSLGREIFPVDTHIHRICQRLGITPNSKTPDQTFEAMQPLIPKGKAYTLHTNIIRFGRKTCIARSPLCGECPLFDECSFPEKEKFAFKKSKPVIGKNYEFMILDNVS